MRTKLVTAVLVAATACSAGEPSASDPNDPHELTACSFEPDLNCEQACAVEPAVPATEECRYTLPSGNLYSCPLASIYEFNGARGCCQSTRDDRNGGSFYRAWTECE